MKQLVSFAVLSYLSLGAVAGCAVATEEIGTDSEALMKGGPRDPIDPIDPAPRPTRPPVVVIDPAPNTPAPGAIADLKLTGVMRYYGGGTPTLGLQINVTNIGDTPATGPSGRVNVGGYVLSAALYQYYGGHATQPNTVNPGEQGYIQVEVPASLMAPCTAYSVQIDLDHTMQFGGDQVFANDSGTVSTVCGLTWNSPIDELHLGHVADPSVNGKTLFNIVSSFVSGRPDGVLCSGCHNSNASYPYHPNVPPNGSAPIDPFLPASGNQTWICLSNPWGPQFVNLPVTVYPHTPHLKEAVQKWMADGGIR
jgi:hypothetical protein